MNILKKYTSVAMAMGLLISVASCDKDDDTKTTTPPVNNDPLKEYVLSGEKSISSADVKLYFAEDAFVGYNIAAVRVLKSGTDEVIENASVSFLPMMDMGTMMHSAPYSNPSFDVDMDAYMGSSTFIMPSVQGSWTLSVIVDIEGAVDTATFDLTVEAKTEAKLISFVSAADGTTMLFVALKEPMAPEVGLNDFEVMVYKRESMMSFPPVTDLNIAIDPEMPTMGHGSPNNENPVHVADGLYSGVVNFTMSGYWKVNMEITDSQSNVVKSDAYFDITFQ